MAGENIALIQYSNQREFFYHRQEELQSLLESLSRGGYYLTQDSTRHRSKQDRLVQRASFRDILDSVENNSSPSITLKVKNEVVDFDSWEKIRLFEVLKDYIGEGINDHLSSNALIKELFEISFDTVNNPISSRLRDVSINKRREKDRKQSRLAKASYD
jgi:hypothetical protein